MSISNKSQGEQILFTVISIMCAILLFSPNLPLLDDSSPIESPSPKSNGKDDPSGSPHFQAESVGLDFSSKGTKETISTGNLDNGPISSNERGGRQNNYLSSRSGGNKSIGAWTIFWDPESHKNITANGDTFTHVYPYWYTINHVGSVSATADPDNDYLNKTSTYHKLGLTVMPILYSGDYETYTYIMETPDLRISHILEIRNLVNIMGFDGIEINYEALPYADRFLFVSFIEDLAAELHTYNKTLCVTLYPRSTGNLSGLACDSYLYEPLGNASDYVKLMAYNEHWSTHPYAGPIASYPWVEGVVKYAVQTIPLEKIILGTPTYGYDWAVDPYGKTVEISRNYSYKDAERVRKQYGVKRLWNVSGRCPYYTYFDDFGYNKLREVHYSDNMSFSYILYLVNKYDIFGVCLWYLGGHDSKINKILEKWKLSDYSNLPPLAHTDTGRFAQVGQPVYFNDSLALDVDGAVYRIQWDFGDGNTSERLNPMHIYYETGLYRVSFVVEDDSGFSDICIAIIKVGPYIYAGPDMVTNEDAETIFDGSSSFDQDGIISYSWDFGDGNIAFHGGAQVSHVYEDPGNYTVKLTVINRTGFTASDNCTVWVRDVTAPTAHVTEHLIIGKGQIASFDASGSTDNGKIVRYKWIFGDGSSVNTTQPWINHVYRKMGNYDLYVMVYDSDGNWDYAKGFVMVVDGDPPSINVTYMSVVPYGTTAFFNASGSTDNINITSYNWTFGDGSGPITTLDSEVEHFYSEPGGYFVTLQILDAVGNWNSTTFSIVVKDVFPPKPVINLSLLEDGNITEQYEYRIENPDAANKTETQVLRAKMNQTIIFNCSKSKDDFGIVNFTWEIGDGSIFHNKTFYFAYSMAGEYTIVLWTADGGNNIEELVVPIVIFEPLPIVANTDGNDANLNNSNITYIPRKGINEALVISFWIIFGIVVIIIILFDVTINIRGLHIEKEMDYYIQKRDTAKKGAKGDLRKKKM